VTGWRRRLTRRPCARGWARASARRSGRTTTLASVHLRGPSEADDGREGGRLFSAANVGLDYTQEHVVQSRILMRSATTYHYWFCVHSSGHNRAADGGLAMCLPQSFLARRHANKRSRWLQMRGSRERKLQTDKKTARGGKAIENTNTMRITECGGPSRPSLQQRAPSRCDPLT